MLVIWIVDTRTSTCIVLHANTTVNLLASRHIVVPVGVITAHTTALIFAPSSKASARGPFASLSHLVPFLVLFTSFLTVDAPPILFRPYEIVSAHTFRWSPRFILHAFALGTGAFDTFEAQRTCQLCFTVVKHGEASTPILEPSREVV